MKIKRKIGMQVKYNLVRTTKANWIIAINLIFFIISLFFNIPLIAEEFNLKTEFDIANKAFTNKKISEALYYYEKILKNGYDNYQINYNIGCCYYKLNELGKARYYLERALFFKPYDQDLYHNLNIIYQKLLINPTQGEQVIVNRRIIFFIPINLVIFLFLIFFFSTLVMLILAYCISYKRKLFFILFSANMLITLLLTIIFFIQYSVLNERTFISTSKTTNIYLTPDENDTIFLMIPEGTRGMILEETANYIKVKLNDDLSGWVNKNNLITDTPPSIR